MSQYIIKTKGYVVTIGWDKPLGYFFLNIENDKEDMLWCNLDQKNAFPKDFVNYQRVIREIVGIELPAEVIKLLCFDQEHNTGNYVREFKV